MPIDLSGVLRTALDQLRSERERIDRQIEAVRSALDGVADRDGTSRGAAPSMRGRRRRMSPAERRAVSERMRAYWAKRRGGASAQTKSETKSTTPSAQARRGRRMSAAARRAVSRRMKAYWAKRRGAAKAKRGKKAA